MWLLVAVIAATAAPRRVRVPASAGGRAPAVRGREAAAGEADFAPPGDEADPDRLLQGGASGYGYGYGASPPLCEGFCGGPIGDGSCWCDAHCALHGDCCAEANATCGFTALNSSVQESSCNR